jgi:hypothetical protein
MIKNVLFVAILFSFSACNFFTKKPKENDKLIDEKIKMIEADKAFSKLSEETGLKNAFLEYLDSNGVLLRPSLLPVIGANAVDYISTQNDKDFKLVWEPKGGEIAQSADLGFTYGVYKLQGSDTVFFGTYVNIWKKQANGSWRFVLNSGNEGLSTEEEEMQNN